MTPMLLEELLLESQRLQRERSLIHELRLREARADIGWTATVRTWFADQLFALGARIAPAGTTWERVRGASHDRRLKMT